MRSEAFFDALLVAVAAEPTLRQVRVATGNEYGAEAFTCLESHDYDLRAASKAAKAQADEGEDWRETSGEEDDTGDDEDENEAVTEEEGTIGAPGSQPRTPMLVPDGTEPDSPSSGASSRSLLCRGQEGAGQFYGSDIEQDTRSMNWEPEQTTVEASLTQGNATPMLDREDSQGSVAPQGQQPGPDGAATPSKNVAASASQGSDEPFYGIVLIETRKYDEQLAKLTDSRADKAQRQKWIARCRSEDDRCIVCKCVDKSPRPKPGGPRDTHQPTTYPFCEPCDKKGTLCKTEGCGNRPLASYGLTLQSSNASKYEGRMVWWWSLRKACKFCLAQSKKKTRKSTGEN